MEQILWLYALPYDPLFPVICLDERPCFLIGDVIDAIAMQSGQVRKEHYAYEKNGSCTLFAAIEPLTGHRLAQVHHRRRKKEFALFCQSLADAYPKARKIRVVLDNLNTHNPSSFYTILEPEQAFTLAARFEMHYTPTKASWLNMVEIELSILSKQCLNRRIANLQTLEREVLAWVDLRNIKQATIHWQFTQNKARDKFKKFYPYPSKLL